MIDNSVLKRLAIQQFGTVLVQGNEYFELDEADLQAFAQAVIENYKASLVPVAWYKPNGHYHDGFILGATKLLKHIESDSYTIPLYALPSGETK